MGFVVKGMKSFYELVNAYNTVPTNVPKVNEKQSLFTQFDAFANLVQWTKDNMKTWKTAAASKAVTGYRNTYPLRLQRAEGVLKGYTFGRREYGEDYSRGSQPFAARGRTYGDDIGYDEFGRYDDYEMDGYYDDDYYGDNYYGGNNYYGAYFDDYFGDDYYGGDYYDDDYYDGAYYYDDDDRKYYYSA